VVIPKEEGFTRFNPYSAEMIPQGGITMYSPKIRKNLIPKIFQKARAEGIHMTDLVNGILEKALNGGDQFGETIANGQKLTFSQKDGGQPGETGS